MTRFKVTATVEVDVEMSIEAETPDAARALFDAGICMSASLVDVPDKMFDVSEDSISGIRDVRAVPDHE